jgi:hypothetical protein
MQRFKGGSKVPGGFYFSIRRWDVVSVCGAQGVLEGDESDRYLRLPLLVMVPVALVLSFVFLIFLPFIGFALVAWTVGRGVGVAVTRLAGQGAAAVAPGWQPGEAHLTGRPQDGAEGGEKSAKLEELEKEIADQRRQSGSRTGSRCGSGSESGSGK